MVKPGLWIAWIGYPVVLIVTVFFGGFVFGPVPVLAQAHQPASQQFPETYKIVKELNFGPFGKEPASASQIVLDESTHHLFIAYRSSSLVAVVDSQTLTVVAHLDFKKKVTQDKWYESIALRYAGEARNSFVTNDTSIFTQKMWNDAVAGARHNIDANTSFKLLKYININIRSYSMCFYFKNIGEC